MSRHVSDARTHFAALKWRLFGVSTKWLGFTTMQDASRAPLLRVGARGRCVCGPAVVWMAENGWCWYMPAVALL
jgi:hypothetical protein